MASRSQLHSRTIWGATPPKVYSPESLQNAGLYDSPCDAGSRLRRDGLLGLAPTASVLVAPFEPDHHPHPGEQVERTMVVHEHVQQTLSAQTLASETSKREWFVSDVFGCNS